MFFAVIFIPFPQRYLLKSAVNGEAEETSADKKRSKNGVTSQTCCYLYCAFPYYHSLFRKFSGSPSSISTVKSQSTLLCPCFLLLFFSLLAFIPLIKRSSNPVKLFSAATFFFFPSESLQRHGKTSSNTINLPCFYFSLHPFWVSEAYILNCDADLCID